MHTLAQPCMQAYDTCTHCSLAHPLHMSPHRPQRRQSDCLRVLARPHRLPRAGAACLLGVLPHSCLSAGYSLGAGTQYSLGAGTSVSVRLVRITAARRLLPPPGSSRLLYQSVPRTRLLEAAVPRVYPVPGSSRLLYLECTPHPAPRGATGVRRCGRRRSDQRGVRCKRRRGGRRGNRCGGRRSNRRGGRRGRRP